MRLRKLEAADAGLLLRWLSNPALLAWYEGRDRHFTPESIRAKFFRNDSVERRIAELETKPVGYLQYYRLTPESRGLDLFLGEPELWNRGLGKELLRAATREIFTDPEARTLELDPRSDNLRAIRCYLGCGFRAIERLPHHELHEGRWCDGLRLRLERGTGIAKNVKNTP